MSGEKSCWPVLCVTVLLLGVGFSPRGLSAGERSTAPPLVSMDQITISLEVRDADVRDVLQALAVQANANLAVTEAAVGRITIRLKDVAWDQGLDAVVATAGLVWCREGNLITVMSPAEVEDLAADMVPVVGLDTKAFNFEYASAEAVREAFLAQITPMGNVALDRQNNSLVVSDAARNLEKLAILAARLDAVPAQVIIDVLMTETLLRDEKDVGVNWEVARTTSNSLVEVAQDLIGAADDGGTITYSKLKGQWTADAFVRVLESLANVRILASPRVLVLSGREAIIETIDELPYQELTQTGEGGQIGTTAWKETGVKLRVTPRITEGGSIVLRIYAEQSNPTGESITQIPVISSRKAETTLVLNDGETVVIGGLRRQDKVKAVSRIPILGSIPLLGALFRRTTTVVEDTELIIFLTPRLFARPALSDREMDIHERYREVLKAPVGGAEEGDEDDNATRHLSLPQ